MQYLGQKLSNKDSKEYDVDGHMHTRNEVGLGNVDNTSDSSKSVSYANNAGKLDGIDSTNFARDRGRIATNLNAYATSPSGFYGLSGTAANGPSGNSYAAMIQARNSDVGLQLLGGYNKDNLWFRGWYSSGGGYTAWRKIWHDGNDGSGSGLDADKVDGKHASSTAGAKNTVVARDASGYIKNTWFNSNRGNETSAAASYLFDKGDGFMRKKTVANVKSELGVPTKLSDLENDVGFQTHAAKITVSATEPINPVAGDVWIG